MEKRQFHILYREFLFRMMDLEVLSAHAQGDMDRLFGQFAAFLVWLSIPLTAPALAAGDPRMGVLGRWMYAVTMEHFLIATTMLAVGIFAVLSWDSTFPERRDVMVLAPLPVRARTLFGAKVAGVGHALGLTVVLLHSLAGAVWPLALHVPGSGFAGVLRLYPAYWFTMLSAGAFMFGSVLGVQGLAAQLLPRRWYLRASSWLQMAIFCLMLCVYCLQPMAPPFQILVGAPAHGLAGWSPSYWFLGMFQRLSGWVPLPALERRAWIGLPIAVAGTALAYLLSYLRTLRQIVEEPDIVPGARRRLPLPRFGAALPTALTQFSIRTFLRSRQHRMVFAFYFGIAFGLCILLLKTPEMDATNPWHDINVPMLSAAILMMCAAAMGARMAFALPLDLRANWVFRATPISGKSVCVTARRRAVLLLAVGPVWTLAACAVLWLWPWRAAAGFLLAYALIGLIAAELCIHGGQTIPFACSYLPGRSRIHLMIATVLLIGAQSLNRGASEVQGAFGSAARYSALIAALGALAALARWRNATAARWEPDRVRFEAEDPEAVLTLNLSGGGANG
jgi:hypothetical protein